MKKIGRTDPTTPVPGRSWYSGAWRTPEEIEMRREYNRRHRAKIGPKRRAAREGGERMRDRSQPVEGRVWYCGRWRTPEQAERHRVKMRDYRRSRYVPRERKNRLTDEERTARAASKRMRAVEKRRSQARSRETARANALAPRTVPADVRRAYGNAQTGSAIKRKYPTWDSLRAGARRGDFERWRV